MWQLAVDAWAFKEGASRRNPDFRDILSAFAEKGVEYLVVGAYALAAHGVTRATGDRDIGAVFGEASALEEAPHPSDLSLLPGCRRQPMLMS